MTDLTPAAQAQHDLSWADAPEGDRDLWALALGSHEGRADNCAACRGLLIIQAEARASAEAEIAELREARDRYRDALDALTRSVEVGWSHDALLGAAATARRILAATTPADDPDDELRADLLREAGA